MGERMDVFEKAPPALPLPARTARTGEVAAETDCTLAISRPPAGAAMMPAGSYSDGTHPHRAPARAVNTRLHQQHRDGERGLRRHASSSRGSFLRRTDTSFRRGLARWADTHGAPPRRRNDLSSRITLSSRQTDYSRRGGYHRLKPEEKRLRHPAVYTAPGPDLDPKPWPVYDGERRTSFPAANQPCGARPTASKMYYLNVMADPCGNGGSCPQPEVEMDMERARLSLRQGKAKSRASSSRTSRLDGGRGPPGRFPRPRRDSCLTIQ